jgi:hypothetical protein
LLFEEHFEYLASIVTYFAVTAQVNLSELELLLEEANAQELNSLDANT